MSIENVPVCTFKTSPCVPAPRAHVETHVRGARTHGDVLNVHTGTFLNPHTGFSTFVQRAATHTHTDKPNTHHDHQQHHDNNDTHHTTQHTTSRGDRERERQRKRDRDRDRDRDGVLSHFGSSRCGSSCFLSWVGGRLVPTFDVGAVSSSIREMRQRPASLVGRDQPPDGSILACLARLERVVEQILATQRSACR